VAVVWLEIADIARDLRHRRHLKTTQAKAIAKIASTAKNCQFENLITGKSLSIPATRTARDRGLCHASFVQTKNSKFEPP